jgi:hypothetical protein
MMSVVRKINWIKVLTLLLIVGVALLLPLLIVHAQDSVAGGGGGGGFNDFVSAVGGFLLSFIYAVFVGLGGAVAGAAAIFLNLTVKLSLDSAVYGVEFVSQGWVIARDLANMAFIFILLYIAFTLMLQANTSNTINMLVGVIAVALVINFSFFFTRIVIDAGNILSIQFYNAIVADSGGESLPVSVFTDIKVPDITSKIMNGLNFQSALSPESLQKITETYKDDIGKLSGTFISFMFVYVMIGIMFLMLAMAFVAAGIKFVIRIVSLWLAIILAPLALVAWSFERSKGGHGGGHGGGYFKRWTTLLLSNAFYPAVFLFILLLISNFMGGQGQGSFDQQLLAAASTNQNGVFALGSIIANIGVRLGFVLVMLYFAIKYSDYGTNIWGADWANRKGADVAFGWTGAILRSTVGRGAAAVSGDWKRKDFIISPLANRSYDGRSLPGLRNLPGAKDLFGEPSGKGGFREEGAKDALLRKALRDPTTLNAHEIDELNHVGAERLARLNAGQMSKIASLLTPDALKGTRAEKHEGPAGKAEEEIQLLREMVDRMGSFEYISDRGLKQISQGLKKNQVLTVEELQRMQQAFRESSRNAERDLAAARTAYRAARTPATTRALTDATNQERNSKVALEQVNDTVKAFKAVPEGARGKINQGH